MQTVRINHANAVVELPAETVISNWLSTLSNQKVAPPTPATGLPKLGQPLANQGGIFAGVIRGTGTDHDRLLIAPTDSAAEFAPIEWGPQGKELDDCGFRRHGLLNTKSMAAAGSDLAARCLALSIDGHNDFYLPSRDELRLCCMNVPELFQEDWYWSSTQYSADYAFSQTFEDGNQGYYAKRTKFRARAVRSIQLSDLVIQ